MDTYQFIVELLKIVAGLAWPAALVAVAYIVKRILDADDDKPEQPKESVSDVRTRHSNPPPPTYPPRW
jgi:hypothetical protein